MALQNAGSMPTLSPSYPLRAFRFINRTYKLAKYKSDPAKIAKVVPAPLVPDGSNLVVFEGMEMRNSPGFGSYCEIGSYIPCKFTDATGKVWEVNYTLAMFLNDLSPIVGGREIWGYPKKDADEVIIEDVRDTTNVVLRYAGIPVATGTFSFKTDDLVAGDPDKAAALIKAMRKPIVNHKRIPSCTGRGWDVDQLVLVRMKDITLKEAYGCTARVDLRPHVQAPLADLPVLEVESGMEIAADMTLPFGEVLWNYLTPDQPTSPEALALLAAA